MGPATSRRCRPAKLGRMSDRTGTAAEAFKEHQAFFMLGGVIRPTIAFSETNILFKMTSRVLWALGDF